MPRNVKIIVKVGATIVEVTEGAGIPMLLEVVMEIPAMGELHRADPRDQDTKDVYEFKFGRRLWTVDADQVEVVN